MFKDYVADDIKNTFFDSTEFADDVEINGTTVCVVEDKERLEYRIKENYGGLIIGDVLFYISKEEYEKIPRVQSTPTVHQAIRYKGKPCTIIDVGSENGVYEIVLQAGG